MKPVRFTSVDEKVDAAFSWSARRLGRRQFLKAGVMTSAAVLAGWSVGEGTALASTPYCSQCPSSGLDAYCCGPTYRCTHWGASCPETGCPSGYSSCTPSNGCTNSQGYHCIYSSGNWVACDGLGHGYGYLVCSDCIGPDGCNHWCTCLSGCICCDCATPADVVAEQQRLLQLSA